jgi:3-oxoacyl-[acyl-carrier protein] reductase
MHETRLTAIVTGASRGIGLAIARDLSRDHDVITIARSAIKDGLNSDEIRRITHLSPIDVQDLRSLEDLAGTLGKCDVLINNVGVAYEGILATQSLENILHMVDVNLNSILYLTKIFVRERLALRKSGIILTISSIVARRGYRGLSVYSATKAALNAMTRSLARELGPKGFRVNTLLPGFIETDMTGELDPAKRSQIINRTPLGRLGSVDDIVPVVRFLISHQAKFLTGQEIVVDGGLTS